MLARLGAHNGVVTNALLNVTPLLARCWSVAGIYSRVSERWSSDTMNTILGRLRSRHPSLNAPSGVQSLITSTRSLPFSACTVSVTGGRGCATPVVVLLNCRIESQSLYCEAV